jgi:serine/threonine-protein kinase
MDIEWVGPYRIVGKLGRGGMGTVYEGVHRDTGERAAVKLLSASLAHETGFRSRFEVEIETLRKLNHPNIVRLTGFGEQDGHLFYAMELVDGNSLEEELRRGRKFEWQEVVQIGLEMCKALRHAHDRGIVHRDIKPGNLLLASDGRVKLSDFGIARFFGGSGLTCAGNVLGTADYMAPEQAEGRPVDARADLYSLGVVMYVLLSRRPMFQGKSLPEILHKQRHEQPLPIRHYAPDTPQAFERILMQLLEKNPSLRFATANVLARRLEAMLEDLARGPETCEANSDWFATNEAASMASSPALPPDADAISQLQTAELSGIDLPPVPSSISQTPCPDETTMAATGVQDSISSMSSTTRPTGHFVQVGEDELDRMEEEIREAPFRSWQFWGLVAALLAVAGGIQWSLQPPSAEALRKRIEAKAETGSLWQVKDDITFFLNNYSQDPYAKRLRVYEKQIALDSLNRRFSPLRNQSRRDLLPIEQEYLDALNYLYLEPERGAAKLQALIDLHEGTGDATGQAADCLTLARQQLADIRAEIKERSADQLADLLSQLDKADAVFSTRPQKAKRIYQAVVDLYAEKFWAADAVARAREALKKEFPPEKEDAEPADPGALTSSDASEAAEVAPVATQEGSPPGENAAKSSDSGAANQNDPSKAAGQDASPAEHSEEKNKEK